MAKTIIAKFNGGRAHWRLWLLGLIPALTALALTAGCESIYPFPEQGGASGTNATEVITLREGDVLKISFPANANLNTVQTIRRDGMISMPLVGELKAAGKTPKELEQDLSNAYSTQLLSKEVTVEVQSSTFPIYVSGAVLRPGKVVFDHPVTVLEAIMEAGGPDYTKANLKSVTVTRLEKGQFKTYTLNVKLMLEGKQSSPFYLKPSDIVKVPERLWY
ncbi:MAG TPA: polysaccharide biosynthesis/export family protein [Candidatus Acidoferrum sp.]|nr:polysaccharide biosynthesis/export family protein [Candidatus Acidoferrum sp.]